MKLHKRSGEPITDWRQWTRPKEAGQWRASRSAMELARAWFTSAVPMVPPELSSLLRSHPLTAGATFDQGWPEWKTPLPYPGEGRNHDLIVLGEANGKRLLLSVEGKVDETMGPEVHHYWRKSKRQPPSRAWRRIDALLTSAFGANARAEEQPWRALPYQLLTALVGTAIEASHRSCSLAVVCLHEFVTESAKPELLRRNADAYVAFLGALGVSKPCLGTLYGPFQVRVPSDPTVVPVLLGKVQFTWTAR